MSLTRLPRDLHPVAWWVWALGLATAASFTTNPLVLLTIAGVASVVVMARRSAQPWADVVPGLRRGRVVIVVMRVLFRVLFGGGADGGVVLLDLPEVPLPGLGAGYAPARAGDPRVAAGRAVRRPAAGAPSSSASARRTRWPTPSGCSARSRPPCTRSAPRWSSPSRCCPSWPRAPVGCGPRRRLRGGGDRAGAGGSGATWCRCSRTRWSARCALAAGMDTRGYGRSAGATAGRAPAHRRADAGRALRRLRRRLRRPRPHRPPAAGHADAGARRGRRGWRGWPSPGAGSGARRYRPGPVARGPRSA